MQTTIGALNVLLGWLWMPMGVLSGSLLGMWSFSGPLPLPKGYETYDSLPRRQVRLAHVSTFALPMINILYGNHLDALRISEAFKIIGSYSMLILMFGIPITLVAASFKPILQYFSYIPVTAGIIGLFIMAYGQYLNL